MSNLMNEEAYLEAVEGCPGASAGEIATHLGMDKSNVRRDLKKLCRDGKVTGQNDGVAIRFYPIGGFGHTHRQSAAPVIDGDFKVLSSGPQIPSVAPSTSNAVAVFDSRLHANSLTRRLPSRPHGGAVWVDMPGAVHIPGNLFDADPDGTMALALLHDQGTSSVRREIAQVRAELREERQKAAAAWEREIERAKIGGAIGSLLNWSTQLAQSTPVEDVQERPPSLLEQARRARDEQKMEAEDRREEEFQESLREQMRRFPPEEWPGLYAHLPEFAHLKPEPATPRRKAETRKPVTPVAAESQRGWLGLIVAAFACVLKFTEKLAA